MARGDGKNKFYKHLEVSKEIFNLIRYYNKVLKPKAYKSSEKPHGCTSGRISVE